MPEFAAFWGEGLFARPTLSEAFSDGPLDAAATGFGTYREGLVDDGRGGPPRWFMQGIFA